MTSYILGGGITGLAAGLSSGLPVLEAAPEPGGICSSYYVRPGSDQRLAHAPSDENAYRFELGGGHWIFGGDPTVLHFLKTLAPVKTYYRQSSVYFREDDLYVPYPLQNHLRFMDRGTVGQILKELARQPGSFQTMEEWMLQYFGPTMCEKFFFPFHDLYTAGLYKTIAPQDAYKSPVSLSHVIQGAFDEAPTVGYNVSFVYPAEGLNALAHRMASLCDMRYNKRVTQIDVDSKELYLADGSVLPYDTLVSTLPLNKMMEMTGLHVPAQQDPHTSVLVLNIGALRGPKCPDDHWLYNPDAKSGFHRVGFYSNVDRSFLPASARARNEAVSIYIERAFVGGDSLTDEEVRDYCDATVKELQDWGYITDAEVVDPTWIDVAYTWSYPNSRWKNQAIQKLEDHSVYQVGRYGRWIFQGIADSIRDGFFAGSSFKYTGAPDMQVRPEPVTARPATPIRKVAGAQTVSSSAPAAQPTAQPTVAARKARAGAAGAD